MTSPPPLAPPPSATVGVVLRELDALLAELEPPPGVVEAADRCAERLRRDLLVRMGGDSPVLVVGIVGPNNAGKSTLFTSLAGEGVSPPSPHGGYTRSLVGVAHPSLVARMEGTGLLSRFDVRRVDAVVSTEQMDAATPATLFLATRDRLPPHLLLIDAPDFDSIFVDNRKAAEAIVVTADLLVVVVTRHTYANRAVREFIADGVRHGRPWVLVVNEALDDAIAAAHAKAVVDDVGAPPLAVFAAPHDLAVARGEKPLVPRSLGGGEPLDLSAWGEDAARELSLKARRASLSALGEEVLALHGSWRGALAGGETLRGETWQLARALGTETAAAAFPTAPLIEAFRTVLDRRGGAHGLWRAPLQWLDRTVTAVRRTAWREIRRLRGPVEESDTPSTDEGLHAHERRAFAGTLPAFTKGLSSLSASLDAGLRAPLDPILASTVSADLSPERLGSIAGALAAALDDDPVVPLSFQQLCEREVEAAIDARGGGAGIQWAASMITAIPAALIAGEVVLTGGLGGGDVLAGAVTALTAPVWASMIDLLGRDLLDRVRQGWVSQRGDVIALAAVEAALPTTWPVLDARRRAWDDTGERLVLLGERLREVEDDDR